MCGRRADYLRALNLVMSFRDTFTRSSSSSEGLRYDDAAAYHFYITVLIIGVLPLGWSLLKTVTSPFSHIPTLSEVEKKRQFRDKIAKFKKENRFNYITFGFFLKVPSSPRRCSSLGPCSTPSQSVRVPSWSPKTKSKGSTLMRSWRSSQMPLSNASRRPTANWLLSTIQIATLTTPRPVPSSSSSPRPMSV